MAVDIGKLRPSVWGPGKKFYKSIKKFGRFAFQKLFKIQNQSFEQARCLTRLDQKDVSDNYIK
jgi:hypothetical protein